MQQLAPRPSLKDRPPYGLMSLWDMIQINAGAFYQVVQYLSVLSFLYHNGVSDPDELIAEDTKNQIANELKLVREGCEVLGASVTLQAVKRLQSSLETDDCKWGIVVRSLPDIERRFMDEIGSLQLYLVEPSAMLAIDSISENMEPHIESSFPSCMSDINEAADCFVFDRHTACVFHLMRVMEVALLSLAKVLLPNDPKPNWDPIIKKIDSELKIPHRERSIKGEERFYADLSAHMHAIKLAWRNRVMHVDHLVSPSKAKAIFDAVVTFMNHLSTRLSESGEIQEDGKLS